MKQEEQPPIKLIVFDLAGTIVDHGCMAPIAAFVEAFRQMGITVSNKQTRGPMGLHKLDHIRELLKLPDVIQQWQDKYDRESTDDDARQIYEAFIPMQRDVAQLHATLIPGFKECAAALKESAIAVATSTGYPRVVADPVFHMAAEQGFGPDNTVCADEVPAGRPAPWMIFRNMEQLGIFPPSAVVKVGDTVPDIQAGRNAGVWTVGVTETGSEFGLTQEELGAFVVNDNVAGFDVQHRFVWVRVITRLAVAVVVNPRNQVRRAGRVFVFDLKHHGVNLHRLRLHSLKRALSSAPDERVQLPHYAAPNV